MSTLAENDPARAIRNALTRLRVASKGTKVERHVEEEGAIIERALEVLAPTPESSEPRCVECGRVRAEPESTCAWCDLFRGL